MASSAADVPVELPPVDQIKHVLMAGIENRLRIIGLERLPLVPKRRFGRPPGQWAVAAEQAGIAESEVSRIRSRDHKRFSLEQLVKLSVALGVKITIRAE